MNILYSFRRCPYAMRARMALLVSGIDYEHREILLRDKPAHMLAASPKATVPVLILDDHVIDESFDIMLWALEQNDPKNWLSPDFPNMLNLINTITGDFKHHLDRYKYASRYAQDENRASIDLTHRQQACEILAEFEDILPTQIYLMGDKPSLADYAIFPFIRQFSNVERDWWNAPEFPAIHGWLDSFLNSDIFQTIMQKHPVWTPKTDEPLPVEP